MSESEDKKRFQDWVEVDCNECARYWDSSCDGSGGRRNPCNSFLATRSVVIPEQIKSLQKRVQWLSWILLIITIAFMIHLVSSIFW